jgi:hypothetical protein
MERFVFADQLPESSKTLDEMPCLGVVLEDPLDFGPTRGVEFPVDIGL